MFLSIVIVVLIGLIIMSVSSFVITYCLTNSFQKTICRPHDGITWASRRKIACTVCLNDKPNGEDTC